MLFGRIVLVVIGLGTLGFGAFAFVRPEALAEIVGLTPTAPEGLTELRAWDGGVEFGLAAFWVGAAFSRNVEEVRYEGYGPGGVAVMVDDTATNFMLIALVTEALSAALALAALVSLPSSQATSAQ